MASYPGTIASFSTKVDGVTTVVAADPNLIQDEVLAIENILGTNPNQSTLASVGSYVSNPISTTFGSVTARIANIEAGLVSSITAGTTNASNTTALTTRVGTAETNITSLTSRMTAAEGVNTTQTSNISTNASNISSLTTRMTAAETTLAGVATDTNLTSLTNRVTAVESVNSTQTTNISSNTSSISSINTTLTGYTTSITTGALITSAASTTAPLGLKITQSTNANSKRASIELGSGWLIGQDSSTSTSGGLKDFFIYDATASAFRLKIGTDGIISTISSLKLRPGTATAGTAPLYFDTVSPVLLTSPVAGAMEYDGTNLYFTPSGVARKTVAYLDSSITGNAATATTLETSRNINGTAFNGSANITVTAAAGTLTGSTLNSGVTASSLTSVGTLANLTVTNTISGSINGTAARATNVAGGIQSQIPIQSAANTTTFINSPLTSGLVLTSSPYPPYAVWGNPTPYRMAAGIAEASDFTNGVSSTISLTAYAFTQPPVVILTPVYTGMNTLYVVSISSTPNTSGFVIRQRLLTSGSSSVAAPTTAINVHWVAIQYSEF